MDPIDMHFRRLIVFRGNIMDGRVWAVGLCWHDGEKLELKQADSSRRDISHLLGLVERPLTGRWAEQYPDVDFYVEIDADAD